MTATAHAPHYRGRFAPSPTGPLHFGSLVSAMGSYLAAKATGGQWLLRIEDIDPPRESPGAATAILHTLEKLGFMWDESVLYQSTRIDAYTEIFNQLHGTAQIYPCSCSRSELLASQPVNAGEELFYPGFCRLQPCHTGPFAYRWRVPTQPIHFHDQLQGTHSINLSTSIGDFIVKRRDGFFAYQLAVVIDDYAQGITDVVRGMDLLFNTPRQIALQHALQLSTPNYLHLPLVVDSQGHKLSKTTQATAIDLVHPQNTLWQALHCLQQTPPLELKTATVSELWCWAIEHWSIETLRGVQQITLPAS